MAMFRALARGSPWHAGLVIRMRTKVVHLRLHEVGGKHRPANVLEVL